jgi:hypothetical protein
MQLITLATADGQVAQRSATIPGQQANLHALDLPEPPKFFDFTIQTETLADAWPARARSNTR